MVKVAITGANSGLALEVIDKLVEGQKHEVLALCRKDPSSFPQQPNVEWVQVTFEDKDELVRLFNGVEVVLNFIVNNTDPENTITKRIIDATIEAGVKRFAPSEWAMGAKLHDIIETLPWYKSKLAIQQYLHDLNKDKKVIEYSLFQTGIFLEYLSYPVQTTKHNPTMSTVIQFDKLRIAAVRGRENDPLVITSVLDIAGIVRAAIEYEGEWPVVGGIQGDRLSLVQIKEIMERVSGKPVELVFSEAEDVDNGILKIEMPPLTHPSIAEEQRQAWHVPGWSGLISATGKGAWDVTDEWNKIFPDYKFITVEEYANNTLGKLHSQ